MLVAKERLRLVVVVVQVINKTVEGDPEPFDELGVWVGLQVGKQSFGRRMPLGAGMEGFAEHHCDWTR